MEKNIQIISELRLLQNSAEDTEELCFMGKMCVLVKPKARVLMELIEEFWS